VGRFLGRADGATAVEYAVMLALIIAVEGARRQRLLIYAAGAALILGIALSRVLLHAHSPLETACGLAIGGAALAFFAGGYRDRRPAAVTPRPLVVALALLLVALHGQELRAEELLQAIGSYLQVASLACA